MNNWGPVILVLIVYPLLCWVVPIVALTVFFLRYRLVRRDRADQAEPLAGYARQKAVVR